MDGALVPMWFHCLLVTNQQVTTHYSHISCQLLLGAHTMDGAHAQLLLQTPAVSRLMMIACELPISSLSAIRSGRRGGDQSQCPLTHNA